MDITDPPSGHWKFRSNGYLDWPQAIPIHGGEDR